MGALKSALEGFDEELVQEIVVDYEERFRIGAENGRSEEEIIKELGSIRDLVEELQEVQQEPKQKQFTEKENIEQEQQSGTYYQEKSFAESFNAAMKKFGKALDGVMKEAGRVIEEATDQIGYHMEEVKKNHYYTYNGDGTCTGSEKDMEGEPNVEQSGSGMEGCKRVVVDADIADVKIRTTKEMEPKAVCHYYSHKTAMLYPFYARQEGDTFYVGISRNQNQEPKSGFFQFSMSPSAEIELLLPEEVRIVETMTSSGDIELNEVNAEEVLLRSKSGEITASYVNCNRCHMEALSGELELVKSNTSTAVLTTKSGDSKVDRLATESLMINTASGDVEVKSVQSANTEVSTASGDIAVDCLKGVNAKFHTASGDMSFEDCHGECLMANAASGDVAIRADYKKYMVKSQSGDVVIESRYDADVDANSTSGDVEIRIVEAKEAYQTMMHSVSGECVISGKTKESEPTRKIEAKTISGSVHVRFL